MTRFVKECAIIDTPKQRFQYQDTQRRWQTDVNTEQWWNVTWQEKSEVGRKPVQCHFAHYKLHSDHDVGNPSMSVQMSVTNLFARAVTMVCICAADFTMLFLSPYNVGGVMTSECRIGSDT
jgi:hypothetical protein